MVGAGRVVVLDEDGSPITGIESLRRFGSFEEGPCPVLEAFALKSAARATAQPPQVRERQAKRLETPRILGWPSRLRPSRRVLGTVRKKNADRQLRSI